MFDEDAANDPLRPPMGLRIAALVKQIPRFECMDLTPDGRLLREGVPLEMNAYCRRAVAKGIELARLSTGSLTVFTLGPPSAEDVLREALACGADSGVLISDPAFAGSDTLATARTLAAALRRKGPFDLVLCGRNSLDADTGQVGPGVAELLDFPFLCAVRELEIAGTRVTARCEQDDGWVRAATTLPAVLSTAERLCPPAKAPPEQRAAVAADRIYRLTATELGPGPWGLAGSATRVGQTRRVAPERMPHKSGGALRCQVREAVGVLLDRGVFAKPVRHAAAGVPEQGSPAGGRDGTPVLAVLVEPRREGLARELLGVAARLAADLRGRVVALLQQAQDPTALASWGADRAVLFAGVEVEEDVAGAVATWARATSPWALLAPGTVFGREVAARVATRLGAGLTGDAVDLEVRDGRLVAWKPAFGDRLAAAITTTSALQMATVRPGVLPILQPRDASAPLEEVAVHPRGRVQVIDRVRDDEVERLNAAQCVIGVGTGVDPDDYARLEPLAELLGAELGATRKVTDRAWMPRARQVGITGHSISPRLYVAIGVSGKYNHTVGIRNAGTVLCINNDPDAPVHEAADVSIVGDWREAVPLLVDELSRRTTLQRAERRTQEGGLRLEP